MKKEILPFVDVKFGYQESFKRYEQAAHMLFISVDALLKSVKPTDPAYRLIETLKPYCDDFRKAWQGE